MDCFVAYGPRNDGECSHDGGACGGDGEAEDKVECDGSGGGGVSGRGGSRQAPALRPAVIQETTPAPIPPPGMSSRGRRPVPSERRGSGTDGTKPREPAETTKPPPTPWAHAAPTRNPPGT